MHFMSAAEIHTVLQRLVVAVPASDALRKGVALAWQAQVRRLRRMQPVSHVPCQACAVALVRFSEPKLLPSFLVALGLPKVHTTHRK